MKLSEKNIFKFLIMILLLAVTGIQSVSAYMVKYKEDWYRLYHVHYQQYPDDCIENIYWLEKAAQADFCNPLYADAKIETEKQWEKYRYLFQHLRLGRTYDKKALYFYDAPWKDEYLRNVEKALTCYNAGLYYWKEAQLWAEKANAREYTFLFITELQNWEDERERIKTGSLDYDKMLRREISRLENIRDELIAMDAKSY